MRWGVAWTFLDLDLTQVISIKVSKVLYKKCQTKPVEDIDLTPISFRYLLTGAKSKIYYYVK